MQISKSISKRNYTLFYKQHCYKCLKLAKNQANAKQLAEDELLLFEDYSHSSSTLSSRNNRASVSVFMRLCD